MRLFLDDERFPPDTWDETGYVIIRDYISFVKFIEEFPLEDRITHISFDHDLGEGKNGYDCVKYLVESDMDYDLLAHGFTYVVHSMNPVGAENISAFLDRYLEWRLSK